MNCEVFLVNNVVNVCPHFELRRPAMFNTGVIVSHITPDLINLEMGRRCGASGLLSGDLHRPSSPSGCTQYRVAACAEPTTDKTERVSKSAEDRDHCASFKPHPRPPLRVRGRSRREGSTRGWRSLR